MTPLLWGDCTQTVVQFVCCGVSIFTMFVSYLFAVRGA